MMNLQVMIINLLYYILIWVVIRQIDETYSLTISKGMVVKFSKTFVYRDLRQSLQSIQELLCTLFGFIFVAILVAYHWYKTYSVI